MVLVLAMLAVPACAQVTVTGECVLTNGGSCVASLGYPSTNYGNNETCLVENVPEVPLIINYFLF
jgi:hypothetical protein